MAAEKTQLQNNNENFEREVADLMKLKDKLLHDNTEQDRELRALRERDDENRKLIDSVKEDLTYC